MAFGVGGKHLAVSSSMTSTSTSTPSPGGGVGLGGGCDLDGVFAFDGGFGTCVDIGLAFGVASVV